MLTLRHLLLCTFLLIPQTLWAFSIGVPQPGSHYPLHWNKSSVTYYVNPLGAPGLTPDVTSQQLQLGFQGWMDVPCGNLKFVLGHHCGNSGACLYDTGKSCSTDADCPSAKNLNVTPVGSTNSRNELVFINSSAWSFGGFVLGVTSPSFDPQNGEIQEADIAFNGYYYNWAANFNDSGPWDQSPTPQNKTKMHLLSVCIHEEGHFFGAQHVLSNFSQSDPPTMAPQVDPYGATATLNADDKKLMCYLYPKTAYTCAVAADCPYVNETNSSGQEYYATQLYCNSGTCGWTKGSGTTTTTGKMGETCSLDSDCTSPLFCQPVDTTSYCSQTCKTASSNCGTGFTCIGYQNGNGTGACIPTSGGGTGPTQNAGDSCSASSDCTTGLCLSAICRVPCTTSNPTECSGTEVCTPTTKTGIGACLPGSGKKNVNAICGDSSECQSGACIGGFCRAKCVNKSNCPSGQGCIAQPEGYSACVPGSGGKLPIGSQCTATSDCISGTCVKLNADDAQAWCRAPCTNGNCGSGESCAVQSDGSEACIPAGADKKGIGVSCDSSDSCDSGLCVAGLNAQVCTQVCTLGDPTTCPCGMECLNTTAGGLCFAGKKVACVGAGGGCANTSECAGGTCTGNICLGGKAPDVDAGPTSGGGDVGSGGTCVVTAIPGTCDSGLNCLRSAADSTSGMCSPIGSKSEYADCSADGECGSLFCAADITAGGTNRCVRPCDPTSNHCGSGQGCHPLGNGLGACYVIAAISDGGGSVASGGGGAKSGCSAGSGGGLGGIFASLACIVWIVGRRRRGGIGES